MDKGGCRIISVEASELYRDIVKNGENVGYRLPKSEGKTSKGGSYKNPYYKQFKNVLDYSSDAIELEKAYYHVYRKKFSFSDEFGSEYTLAVINVKFTKVYYGDTEGNSSRNRPEKNLKELREYFYENGFNCEGVRYVRYKRSSGSSRQGKCLFIDENLYSRMARWGECGLKSNGDASSWEAYKSLSLSSIKGFVTIPLDGILFVPDCKSKFTENCVSVEKDGERLVSKRKDVEIVSDIWDGESLLDESVFEKSEYKDKHMLLLRNKFFKSCAFRTKLQKWFSDKNITSVDGLKARGFVTFAEDISQIIMVTTPNSMKFLRFMTGGLTESNVKKWLAHVTDNFGVVKYDKRTKYFGGRMVQSSYQFINTIGMNEEQVTELLLPSRTYMSVLRADSDFMRYHFETAYRKEDDGEKEDMLDGLAERSEVIFRLMSINGEFEKTRLYADFKNDVIEGLKNRLRSGNILLPGTNATLFGNGPELLMALSGEFDIGNPPLGSSVLKSGEVACRGFENGKRVVCARSPHITMGNLYCATNNTVGSIWQYFDLGKNIICVNAIGEDIQQRLNGCDYDSDSMLVTDDELIVNQAWRQNGKFKVPVCNIGSKYKCGQSLADLDYDISENKIGEIVNLSQKLNCILWDMIGAKTASQDDIDKIYDDICILSVLSGVEIDKAKRLYDADAGAELAVLAKKYREKKPRFFEFLNSQKANENAKYKEKPQGETTAQDGKKESKYRFYDSSMEHVYRLASSIGFRCGKTKLGQYARIIDMIDEPKSIVSTSYKRKDDIIALCERYESDITGLKAEQRLADEEEREILRERIVEMKNAMRAETEKAIKDEGDLYLVIKHFDRDSVRSWHLYAMLFESEMFRRMLKKSQRDKRTIIEAEDGEYTLFNKKYTKIPR